MLDERVPVGFIAHEIFKDVGPLIYVKEEKSFVDTRIVVAQRLGYDPHSPEEMEKEIGEEEFNTFFAPFIEEVLTSKTIVVGWRTQEELDELQENYAVMMVANIKQLAVYEVDDGDGRFFVAVSHDDN